MQRSIISPRDRVVGILNALTDLPALSPIVVELQKVLADPESSAKDVADLISSDQSLVARLLRLANSALFARMGQVGTVSEAVVVLGFQRVRSVVLACGIQDCLGSSNHIGLHRAIWRHSYVTAGVSRRLAERTGLRDPEEAFVAGLLHDVGRAGFLVLCPSEVLACIDDVTDVKPLLQCEREHLGITHAELGSRLLMHWNLPYDLTVTAAGHHDPRRGFEFSLLLSIVCVANEAANRAGHYSGDPHPRALNWDQLSELLPVTADSFDEVVEMARAEGERALAFLASLSAGV